MGHLATQLSAIGRSGKFLTTSDCLRCSIACHGAFHDCPHQTIDKPRSKFAFCLCNSFPHGLVCPHGSLLALSTVRHFRDWKALLHSAKMHYSSNVESYMARPAQGALHEKFNTNAMGPSEWFILSLTELASVFPLNLVSEKYDPFHYTDVTTRTSRSERLNNLLVIQFYSVTDDRCLPLSLSRSPASSEARPRSRLHESSKVTPPGTSTAHGRYFVR